jgi:hypothetical protein
MQPLGTESLDVTIGITVPFSSPPIQSQRFGQILIDPSAVLIALREVIGTRLLIPAIALNGFADVPFEVAISALVSNALRHIAPGELQTVRSPLADATAALICNRQMECRIRCSSLMG